MRVPDYPTYARQSRDFLRSSLGVTSSHNDLAPWILAFDPPNCRPGILICCRSNRASIQNDDLCLLRPRRLLATQLSKLALYSGAIGLRRSTAKIYYVKSRHSHIVT
jgi:hypothetical protein